MLKRVANIADAPEQPPADGVGAAGGTYVFDSLGRLVAADPTAASWAATVCPDGPRGVASLRDLVGEPRAELILEELLSQQSANRIVATLAGKVDEEPPFEVELRRLEGADGPLLLAIVRPSATGELGRCDPLTGLADRDAVEPWIAARRRGGNGAVAPFAVLFLDLDEFKQVNDQHGHAVGDEVLSTLAERWSAAIREGDLLTRYGGDEFVLLLSGIRTRGEAAPIVERLRKATLAPIEVGGVAVQLSVTIGAALSERDGNEPAGLIAAADADMYAQKAEAPQHPRPK
ncbi:GGDEF domain-containing protein [Lacipirellula sp.]|uniref:GGDEF domain-containing protein n=1 Tax=Lacipirellula sp. TaxID=2691419 RepID=UPI003D0FEAF2